ncbi:hypothetical protein RJT34_08099 [Clitoria ternatea]|uniref:Uncharacterized protein n=1 Tax=Clitoria ternatea TaxID=43366 RepID=A0AAN9PSK8_CLITE
MWEQGGRIEKKMGSCIVKSIVSLLLLMVIPVAYSVDPAEIPELLHHGGRVLTGRLNIGILWYGPIPKGQKRAILSFLRSLNTNGTGASNQPNVATWWNKVESYQSFTKPAAQSTTTPSTILVKVVNQAYDPNYSIGKVIITDFVKRLIPAATGGKPNTLAVIVATRGVTIQDMCAGECAQHGRVDDQLYVAVGDPEDECPVCAWPFKESANKKGQTLKPPSGDVGADVMVRLLAGGLAGAVTNPHDDGFYALARGEILIEATSKCPDIFASGGNVLLDETNGGAYNAVGSKGEKFLLPAIWDPASSSCWTPI